MDFKQSNLDGGSISVFGSSSAVYGNESLSNRFRTIFMMGDGGNAKKLIGKNIIKSNLGILAGAVASTVEDTVDEMKKNQDILPATERIVDAYLSKIEINDSAMVVALIEIIPEEKETDLFLRLPIVQRRS